ncbi:MAG: hypothetical protein AAGH46_11085, partial [Bacteroidota bacterium]
MKFFRLLIVFMTLVTACKNQNNADSVTSQASAEDGLVTMRGEFIYFDGAAVLQTPNTIYGVVLDDMADTLREEVKSFQVNETDMVTVTLRAKRIPKPEEEEGWPFRIQIKEILKIEQPEQGAQD